MIVRKRWSRNYQWWVVVCQSDNGISPTGFRVYWANSAQKAVNQYANESGAIYLETVCRMLRAIGCGRRKVDAEAEYRRLRSLEHQLEHEVFSIIPPIEALTTGTVCPQCGHHDHDGADGAVCPVCDATLELLNG